MSVTTFADLSSMVPRLVSAFKNIDSFQDAGAVATDVAQTASQIAEGPTIQVDAGNIVLLVLWAIVVLIFSLATMYGAARLSYCYNIFIGNSETAALLYSILCFFFSGIYYPFYALSLSPVCGLGKGRVNRINVSA